MFERNYFLMNETVEGGESGGAVNTEATSTPPSSDHIQIPTYTATVPVQSRQAPANEFLSQLSEEYRSVDALKNVKDVNDLAKQYVNAQKLIGKKSIGIPDENSTPEQIQEFYSKLRPETYDKYEFNDEVLGGLERDEAEAEAVKKIFHEAGLSTKQARYIQEKYDALMAESYKEPTIEEQEASFSKAGSEVFGDRYDSIINDAMNIGPDLIPESIKGLEINPDDNTLLAIAGILSHVKNKYASEDNIPTGTGNATSNWRDEAKNLMASPAYSSGLHPDHDKITARVRELYKNNAR